MKVAVRISKKNCDKSDILFYSKTILELQITILII